MEKTTRLILSLGWDGSVNVRGRGEEPDNRPPLWSLPIGAEDARRLGWALGMMAPGSEPEVLQPDNVLRGTRVLLVPDRDLAAGFWLGLEDPVFHLASSTAGFMAHAIRLRWDQSEELLEALDRVLAGSHERDPEELRVEPQMAQPVYGWDPAGNGPQVTYCGTVFPLWPGDPLSRLFPFRPDMAPVSGGDVVAELLEEGLEESIAESMDRQPGLWAGVPRSLTGMEGR